MDWPDYLREQATMYRQQAEQTDDPIFKNELLELASVCEEVANNLKIISQAGEFRRLAESWTCRGRRKSPLAKCANPAFAAFWCIARTITAPIILRCAPIL